MLADLHCLKSATVYRTLIQRISKPPKAEDKWSEEFPTLRKMIPRTFIPYRTGLFLIPKYVFFNTNF